MNDNQTVQYGGVNLFGMTFIVFLVLKLCGTITWSWWLVTAPLWIPFGLLFVIAFIIGFVYAFAKAFNKR